MDVHVDLVVAGVGIWEMALSEIAKGVINRGIGEVTSTRVIKGIYKRKVKNFYTLRRR